MNEINPETLFIAQKCFCFILKSKATEEKNSPNQLDETQSTLSDSANYHKINFRYSSIHYGFQCYSIILNIFKKFQGLEIKIFVNIIECCFNNNELLLNYLFKFRHYLIQVAANKMNKSYLIIFIG